MYVPSAQLEFNNMVVEVLLLIRLNVMHGFWSGSSIYKIWILATVNVCDVMCGAEKALHEKPSSCVAGEG